jgi:hypothetical protein
MDRTVRASPDGESGDADAARLRMLLAVSLRDSGLEHRTLSTGNYVRTHRMDHAPPGAQRLATSREASPQHLLRPRLMGCARLPALSALTHGFNRRSSALALSPYPQLIRGNVNITTSNSRPKMNI